MSHKNKGLILRIRKSRTFKGMATFLALSIFFEMVQPTVSLALTEGPSQPEVQSFEPINTTQMVDLFSGDFNYNIPLFNLPGPNGGYPVNMAYHAGVSMDDEASWVGLGWNINVGSLVRNMRGLPDEFASTTNEDGEVSGGDYIYTKNDMKESWSLGLTMGFAPELFGGNLGAGTGILSTSIKYNNYNGIGATVSFPLSNNADESTSPLKASLSLDSENGLGVNASLSLRDKRHEKINGTSLGVSFDGDLSINFGLSVQNEKKDESGSIMWKANKNVGCAISFARSNFTPSIGLKQTSYGFSASLGAGQSLLPGLFYQNPASISFNIQDLKNEEKTGIKKPILGYAKNGSSQNSEFTKDFVRMNDGQVTEETAFLPHSFFANDAFSSTGQGLAGYFRSRRNDAGYVHDPYNRNTSWNASVSLDWEKVTTTTIVSAPINLPGFVNIPVGIYVNTTKHLGIGGSFGFGWNTQRAWDNITGEGVNEMAKAFHNTEPLGLAEVLYYQVHGEQTIQHPDSKNHINGNALTWMTLEPETSISFLAGKRDIVAADNQHVAGFRDASSEREVRNTLVHSFKNHEVANLGEFQIRHYDLSSSLNFGTAPSISLNRASRGIDIFKWEDNTPKTESISLNNHIAGYKVLNEQGSYYVYGLPAYNKKEVQNVFSVDGAYDYSGFNPESSDVVEIDTFFQNVPGTGTDQIEVNYKVGNSDKYINKKTTTPYAHSYMLTSVQGADYVDITNNGPTDDDLGYWVKFDYGKYADNYKWRAPYQGANYMDGHTYTRTDDKGSYSYGEKEVWYLTRIETKSHIAIFELSERTDMVEAKREFVTKSEVPDLTNNKSGLKIDKIKIYDKASYEANASTAVPLQVVHFQYDYSLCKGAPNNKNFGGSSNTGKLTLKKVWFTSNGSSRGALNKYEFDYETISTSSAMTGLVNPDYDKNKYDSWGNYQPFGGASNYGQHVNFPYVNQTTGGWEQSWMSGAYSTIGGTVFETEANKEITKEANDLLASTWSLKKIKLPSGGEINIEYESDDYSHVQHKVANQMFKIVKLGDFFGLEDNEVYNPLLENPYSDELTDADEKARRIYFQLEEPLVTSMDDPELAAEIYKKYVEPLMVDENGERNLYFKSRMQLTQMEGAETYDYVRGYLPLEKNSIKYQDSNPYYNCGVLKVSSATIEAKFTENGTEKYAIGYVTIQAGKKKNGADYFNEYHPMALSAWTYMQTTTPQLLNPASTFNSGSPQNAGDIVGLFTNILNVVPQTMSSFGAIRPYCASKRFAQFIDLESSCIKLASPDKIKFGGGHRVKSISIKDNWSADDTGGADKTYGQQFDYTIKDDEGNVVSSSGVATYEPQLGGDENALKYPIYFWGKNKMITNNNLFTEGPINEDLFPGASVGYRQVTVTSLNTYDQMAKVETDREGRTSGIAIHEFFTAKDFPTLVEKSFLSENNNTKDYFKVPIPIPLIGSISRSYYHGTQGFKIELNDMHGKPKGSRTYETTGYVRGLDPITESINEYQSKKILYQGEWVYQLDNDVTIIPKNTTFSVKEVLEDTSDDFVREMGVEAELFTDAREFKTFNQSIGLDFNADILTILPLFSFWPSVNNHKTLFRTHVTNKVVHKSGILKKSIQRDLQASNSSEILAYDEKAGIPMVAKTTNEFGDDFYSYNIPAYYNYDNMGHAYQNIDYRFRATVVENVSNTTGAHGGNYLHVTGFNSEDIDNLVRGDELLVTAYKKTSSSTFVGSSGNNSMKGYLLGFEYDDQNKIEAIIHFPNADGLSTTDFPSGLSLTAMTELDLQFRVIRSGRRNHYGSMSAGYTTKGMPDFMSTDATITNVTVPSSHNITTPKLTLGTVLSASASLFKDDWNNNDLFGTDKEDNVVLAALITDNPYLTGNSGIWRPYKSYSYVDERSAPANYTANNTTTEPDLRHDGLLTSEIPMFSYMIGDLENYQDKWEWTNEVTRFNGDSYEIENVNRIGIHSSALYGYDNSLTIAVGGNAAISELGAMDFESSANYNQFGASLKQTNLNFHNESSSFTSYYLTDALSIKYATYDGTDITIVLNTPYTGFTLTDYEPEVGLTVNRTENSNGGGNDMQFLNGSIDFSAGVTQFTEGSNSYAQIVVIPSIDKAVQQILPSSTIYTGKVRLLREKMAPSENAHSSVTFVATKAHTGKKSMKVTSTISFAQQKLEPVKNKRYILSAWVSRDNEKQVTYDPASLIQIKRTDGTTSGITIYTTDVSKVVEGWQKVDIEFEVNVDHAVIVFQFIPGGSALYVDDLRFSPKTGGITTYVYDPVKFWLRASLNVDNYATLFFYDEEGNLTLKKQETEKGIFTITESRGHVSESN